MILTELLAWQNVIFWAPMVVGTLLYVFSSVMGGEHEHGDAHTDVHAHMETHADTAADGDAEAGLGHESDYHPGIAGFFSLGKVPVAAILASLLFGWGIAG